ncbi:hypothetical protein HOLleu_21929 [Holothuria leucospilota]|uniref:Uncharacterized protein n=1 Tax=Holothuria leucospilota TaxID=206669 RepID=A0A9Q1H6F0_HOLLE|nr:hypothetical protein HOLleu_21929 [Holothuria leucospilota]
MISSYVGVRGDVSLEILVSPCTHFRILCCLNRRYIRRRASEKAVLGVGGSSKHIESGKHLQFVCITFSNCWPKDLLREDGGHLKAALCKQDSVCRPETFPVMLGILWLT